MVETLHRLRHKRLQRRAGAAGQPIPEPHFSQSVAAVGTLKEPPVGPAVVDGMVIEPGTPEVPAPETVPTDSSTARDAGEQLATADQHCESDQKRTGDRGMSAAGQPAEPAGDGRQQQAGDKAGSKPAAASIDVTVKTARSDQPSRSGSQHPSGHCTSTLNWPTFLRVGPGARSAKAKVRSRQIDPFALIYRELERVAHLPTQRLLALTALRPGPESGHVAIQLAQAAANGGQRRVLLIDLAIQHRPLAELLGIPQKPDLIDVLDGGAKHTEAIRWVAAQHFWLLGVRSGQRNLEQEMHGRRMSTLMAELRDGFDLTLVHGLDLRDSRTPVWIASRCDLAVLLLPLGKVTRGVAQRAIDRLTRAGATVGGCILTRQ